MIIQKSGSFSVLIYTSWDWTSGWLLHNNHLPASLLQKAFFLVSLNISVKAVSESTVLCDISKTSGNVEPLSSS